MKGFIVIAKDFVLNAFFQIYTPQIIPVTSIIAFIYLSKKGYLRGLVFDISKWAFKIHSRLKYPILRTIFFAFWHLIAVFLLIIVSIIFEICNLKHGLIDSVATIMSCYVVLRSMIIFSGEDKDGFAFWLTIFVLTIQKMSFKENIKTHFEIIKIGIFGLEISLYNIIVAIISLIILFWLLGVLLSVGNRIIKALHQNDPHEGALQYKIFSYSISFVTIIAILSASGLKTSHIAVFGSAIGIGIGLGLQKMASSIISGIILLAEKNIRIGDIIELEEGQVGCVKSLGVRSIVVTTFDGKDMIIPNEQMISNTSINYTLLDKKIRLSANFYLVNKSDIKTAIELMRRACLMQKDISREKPIVCCARDIKDKGVHLMSLFWISDYEQDDVLRIKSNVISSTLNLMEEKGIDLYFEKSLSILRETMNKVTETDMQKNEVPLVNRFRNRPIHAHQENTILNKSKKNRFSDEEY